MATAACTRHNCQTGLQPGEMDRVIAVSAVARAAEIRFFYALSRKFAQHQQPTRVVLIALCLKAYAKASDTVHLDVAPRLVGVLWGVADLRFVPTLAVMSFTAAVIVAASHERAIQAPGLGRRKSVRVMLDLIGSCKRQCPLDRRVRCSHRRSEGRRCRRSRHLPGIFHYSYA